MKPKLILWRDASGLKDTGQNEWFTLEEAQEKAKSLWEEYVETIGWVIDENADFLIVASSRSAGVYSDITMIPRVLIFKIDAYERLR